MNTYTIRFTKRAVEDINQLRPSQRVKLRYICDEILSKNPRVGKKLIGDLLGNYSYRLSFKDRIIYVISEEEKIIYIKRAKTHYDK